MQNWFTVEQIDNETYAISEYKHWEETHCYLLCGEGTAVLIDTGLGISNIKEVVKHLTPLPVTVMTTHAHWDHIGGHKHFETIAVHEKEKDWLSVQFPLPLQVVKQNLTHKPCNFPEGFSIENYQIFQGSPKRILHDGDRIDLGNRTLTGIHTPGHSPGHCCFYEPDRKYVYTGDLVYHGCLDAFYPTTDPHLFHQSVKKIRTLDFDRLLPGHHQLTVALDLAERIDKAFASLKDRGQLHQGTGIWNFGDFQIHI